MKLVAGKKNAQEWLAKLRPNTDTLITVPNDRLLQIAPRDLPLELAFRLADDVLRQGIQGISELVLQSGLINVDFAHIRQMMLKGGGSFLSIGYGEGEDKAAKAIANALHHPLLESIPVENASGIIANFTGGNDLTFLEVTTALETLQEKTNRQAEIIPGVISNDQMVDRAQAILVITGIGATPVETTTHSLAEQPAETSQKHSESMQLPFSQPAPLAQIELAGATNDIDLPAFLRRRIR